MGGHPFLEVACVICNQPLDLQADLSADENGKAVHEECYAKRIVSSMGSSPAAVIAT